MDCKQLSPIDILIRLDREQPKRILVVGDSMRDDWLIGKITGCQDGCPCFKIEREEHTPGGAANAERQLERWTTKTVLYATGLTPARKVRLIDGERIVYRIDREYYQQQIIPTATAIFRDELPQFISNGNWHGVLISDYDKGFLNETTIRKIIDTCTERRIPVVADGKKHPKKYRGAILKCNEHYAAQHEEHYLSSDETCIVTYGPHPPEVTWGNRLSKFRPDCKPPVQLVNHVGAGDCFAAHLTLALAHGIDMKDAVTIAHSAGRVFVQHPFSRPPWPHEIRKDLDPFMGKVITPSMLSALRQSIPGKIVLTNGVFRIPHAGHAWLFDWARQQGDTLVVAVNDDLSAFRQRPSEFVLPLEERLRSIASIGAVDWVVAFSENTPEETIKALLPDVLVKGSEFAGVHVPGWDLVPDTRYAPEGPFPERHATSLVAAIRS